MTTFIRLTDDLIIDIDQVYSIHKCDRGIQINFTKGSYEVVDNGTIDAVHEMMKEMYRIA